MIKKLIFGLLSIVAGGALFLGVSAAFLGIQGRLNQAGLQEILGSEPEAVEEDSAADGEAGEETEKGEEEVDEEELEVNEELGLVPEDVPEDSPGMRDLKDRMAAEWGDPPGSQAYTPYGELRHLSGKMFQLPSPFSVEDLTVLVEELKGGLASIQTRSARLASRQEEVDTIRRDLDQRREELDQELEKLRYLGEEVEAQKKSIQRTVTILKETEESSLKSLAKIYEGMTAQSVVNSLSKMEESEAAKILSKMTPRSAAEALSVMDAEQASSLSLLLKNLIQDKAFKGER